MGERPIAEVLARRVVTNVTSDGARCTERVTPEVGVILACDRAEAYVGCNRGQLGSAGLKPCAHISADPKRHRMDEQHLPWHHVAADKFTLFAGTVDEVLDRRPHVATSWVPRLVRLSSDTVDDTKCGANWRPAATEY
jgi:hypothetical protein